MSTLLPHTVGMTTDLDELAAATITLRQAQAAYDALWAAAIRGPASSAAIARATGLTRQGVSVYRRRMNPPYERPDPNTEAA